MAESKSITEESISASESSADLAHTLGAMFGSARDAMAIHYPRFDDNESIIIQENRDRLSKNYKSQVNDGRLSTIVWDRCARVMAQTPKGQVRALTQKNKGPSAAMDMALWRYVIPNAKEQFDNHLTQLRMWNFYSAAYGTMPMLYKWKVSDQYVGPASELIPIRNWFPQPGKLNVTSSGWMMVQSVFSVGELRRYLQDKTGTWNTKELEEVCRKAAKTGGPEQKESNQQSVVEQRDNIPTGGGKGDFAEVKVITCYEAGKEGHWISFCPDFDNKIIRDIKNPHGNSKIPIVLKYCFPLIDSIIGLGDFERGKTLQFALNSVINLFLDTMKMQLFSPLAVNMNEIYPSSFKIAPGAIWKTKSAPNAAIQPLNFSPQGLNTFQSVHAHLAAALQNQSGTTTAEFSESESGDPNVGKTPDAIQMMKARESARDNWDRFMIEGSIQDLYEGFVNMLAKNNNGRDAIFHIFDDDIEEVKKQAGFEDADKVFTVFDDKKTAKVRISTKDLKDTEFKFLITQGSTRKEDQKVAYENLGNILSVLPNFGDKLMEAQATVRWGELIKQLVLNSGIENADKIVVPDKEAQQKLEAAQTKQEKEANFTNRNYKDTPEDIKRLDEMEDYGVASKMLSPEQQKLQLQARKQELAERKQEFAEDKAAAEHAIKEDDQDMRANDQTVAHTEAAMRTAQALAGPEASPQGAGQPGQPGQAPAGGQPSGETVQIEVPKELLDHPLIQWAEQEAEGVGLPQGPEQIDPDVAAMVQPHFGGQQ